MAGNGSSYLAVTPVVIFC